MNHPPFGELEWKLHSYLSEWEGMVRLKLFKNCWIKWDRCGRQLNDYRGDTHRRGDFPLMITPRHADSQNPEMATIGPYAEQIAAFDHLLANESSVCRLVLGGIAKYFAANWADYYRDDGASEELIERVSTHKGIGETLRLNRLSVHNKFRDNSAYIGCGFNCSWEEEHGVGILLHGSRIVDIAGEDVSFNPSSWGDSAVVEKDA